MVVAAATVAGFALKGILFPIVDPHRDGNLRQSMAQMFLTDNNPLDGTLIARQFVHELFLGQVGFFDMWFSPGPTKSHRPCIFFLLFFFFVAR